jgi:hypothetical protein
MQWTSYDHNFDTGLWTELLVDVSEEQEGRLETKRISIRINPDRKSEESLTISMLEGYKPRFDYSGADKALLSAG